MENKITVNFGLIGKSNSKNTITNPTELFNALPKQYEYLRDVQSQVLEEWYSKRNENDLIIKMNTGSGKTVVSLLILKSSLNEKKGPALYVVPNKFLKNQVILEAQKLGINVTEQEDADFLSGKSILIINSHQLFNGKSKFKNTNIGTILFDDVHAILSILEQQFTITIPRKNELFEKIVNLFKENLEEQDPIKFEEFKSDRLQGNMIVPFWAWQDKHLEVFKLLMAEEKKESKNPKKEVTFKLDLIKDNLKFYECIIDKNSIEITFDQIPIDIINSYKICKRRIFTTATLANDGLLLSHFNLNLPQEAITPKSCSDIGERMILIPKLINPNLSNDEIKLNLKEKSKEYNIVVLVPSFKKSNEWEDYADLIIKDDIEKNIKKLKEKHIGLVVLINRYEGIDLPNDACRILVIDDLPKIERKYTGLMDGIMRNNIETISNNIQKVEQGMGRGVRSREDYCVVLLLGDLLTDLITRNRDKLEKLFSIATLTQFEVSNQLMDQVKGKKITIKDLNALMNYCLDRNPEWIQSLKGALAEKNYHKKLHISKEIKTLRESYNLVSNGNIENGIEQIINLSNEDILHEIKGFLLQKAAKYENSINPLEAQHLLKSAHKFSKLLVNPIEGIKNQRKILKSTKQIDYLIKKLKETGTNEYIIKINAIKSKLKFEDGEFNSFEDGINELGELLGFPSTRPDKNKGCGPDNLWSINKNEYLVIECKNEAKTDFISKDYCNQLSGSINWFNEVYNMSHEFVGIPIIIHPSNQVPPEASPHKNMKCIDKDKLKLIKKNLSDFGKALSELKNYDNDYIFKILTLYHFNSNSFVDYYTKNFKKIRSV